MTNAQEESLFRDRGASIWKAAEDGNLHSVIYYIETEKKKVDAVDEDQRTALHWASAKGHQNIVEYLIKHGANPDPVDDSGWSALISACSTGQQDVVRTLLETNKVDVNRMNETGRAPLHYACSKAYTSVVELLLAHGASINQKDGYGATPLHRAVGSTSVNKVGCEAIVKILLKHRCNVKSKDKSGVSALHMACIESNLIVAKMLIESGADVLDENEDGKNALELAAEGEFRDQILNLARTLSVQSSLKNL